MEVEHSQGKVGINELKDLRALILPYEGQNFIKQYLTIVRLNHISERL